MSIIKFSSHPIGFGEVVDDLGDNPPSGNPIQHSHEYVSDENQGLYVGVWDTTDMMEPAEPYSMDEFMLVLEGRAIIKNNRTNESTIVNTGDVFVIPKGYDCQWIQQGYLRKFYFISDHPDETIPSKPTHEGVVLPIVSNPKQQASQVNPFLQDDSLGQYVFNDYQNNTGKFNVSTWQADAFNSTLGAFPYHQLFVLKEGNIKVIDENQVDHNFVAGDVFYITEGTMCRAETSATTVFISVSLKA